MPVEFTDGAYYNFPESQKIVDGVYMIKAKGHTRGNSIVIAEWGDLFCMMHGDITYVDEALHEDWKCPRCKRPKEKFNRA